MPRRWWQAWVHRVLGGILSCCWLNEYLCLPLATLQLAYGKPEALDPGTQGAWNLRQVQFPVPSPLYSWACVSLMDQREVDLQVRAGLMAGGRAMWTAPGLLAGQQHKQARAVLLQSVSYPLPPSHVPPSQEGHPQSLKTFVQELTKMCNDCGMRTVVPPIAHYDRTCSVQEHVDYAIKEANQAFGKPCARRERLLGARLGAGEGTWGCVL